MLIYIRNIFIKNKYIIYYILIFIIILNSIFILLYQSYY